MKRLRWILLPALLCAAPALGDVPSPNTSTVDPCLVLCPAGDLVFKVVVRFTNGLPYPGAWVDLEHSSCPDFRLGPPREGDPYQLLSGAGFALVRVTSDAQGVALFPVRAGGSCAAGGVRVYADGVLLATRALASPDQDGDGLVGASDAALLQAKTGGTDPTGDLDCSASVTAADAALLDAHFGHGWNLPTAARTGTWGRLKTLYR